MRNAKPTDLTDVFACKREYRHVISVNDTLTHILSSKPSRSFGASFSSFAVCRVATRMRQRRLCGMALASGLRHAPGPFELLNTFPDRHLLPLARGRQTNPVYTAPPGARDSEQVLPHCGERIETILEANLFQVGEGTYFLAAHTEIGWINVWRGRDVAGEGTLFCDVAMLRPAASLASVGAGRGSGDLSAAGHTAPPPCGICQHALGDDTTSWLKCGHGFHAECLRPWLARSTRCPLCRHNHVECMRHCLCGECRLAWFVDGWECPRAFASKR